MKCPNCTEELKHVDCYGEGNYAAYEKYGYGWKKLGDIWECDNEDCCMGNDNFYHTDAAGELYDGYPC